MLGALDIHPDHKSVPKHTPHIKAITGKRPFKDYSTFKIKLGHSGVPTHPPAYLPSRPQVSDNAKDEIQLHD